MTSEEKQAAMRLRWQKIRKENRPAAKRAKRLAEWWKAEKRSRRK